MSSLNTFGAIFTYAIDLETRLRDYYESAGVSVQARDADKRREKLERVRRENVVEITLEPIEGLNVADYTFDLSDVSQTGQNTAESVAMRFYNDVAPKINVRQAQRVLERCGKEHARLT